MNEGYPSVDGEFGRYIFGWLAISRDYVDSDASKIGLATVGIKGSSCY